MTDAEKRHERALLALAKLQRYPTARRALAWALAPPKKLTVEAFGLSFPSPVCLAAGFDKNGEVPDALLALGFGAVEVGTVTAHPQAGWDPPRVDLLPDQRAVVNSMGFPNVGAASLRWNLQHRERPQGTVGVSLGVNRWTPSEEIAQSFLEALAWVVDIADYVVLNISSPNTEVLTSLRSRLALRKTLLTVQRTMLPPGGRRPPLLVKLSPDLTDAELDTALELAVTSGVAGVVAANSLPTERWGRKAGLSGAPLREASNRVVSRAVEAGLTVVASGGVLTADDVREKLDLGAKLVQVYTGFVYGGPLFPWRLARDLERRSRW